MPKPGKKSEPNRLGASQKSTVQPDPNNQYYRTNNCALSKEDNKISKTTVQDQLSRAPSPNQTGRSGYPHIYQNRDRGPDNKPLFPETPNPSANTYHEYPVMKNGSNYAFDRKPKDNPGPMRAIANEKKNLQGVISHNGEAGNPNAGRFHRAVLGNTQPGPPGVDREPARPDPKDSQAPVGNDKKRLFGKEGNRPDQASRSAKP